MQFLLRDIVKKVAVKALYGNQELVIGSVVSMGDPETNSTSLFWCSDKNREQLLAVKTGIVIVSEETYNFVTAQAKTAGDAITWMVVEKPRLAFMQVLKHMQEGTVQRGIVSASASIHTSVVLDRSTVFIGDNVVIEADVVLGKNVTIDHNTVIKSGTKIGDHVKVGSNCTIGGVGFGYELNEEGEYELIPHIGNVVLKNYVEIGNNTCIDRAVLGSTLLEEHVKVDNLVHIAHGVQIGKNSLIIANAMIAGSVKIGENCWVAPSVSVIQKTNVGNDSVIGLGSVVIRDVEARTIVAGVPAKKLKDK
jgi:UDP-3-O-[3-hydroxymyristoyl] glucosamine N-acyltransferase